MIEEIESSAVDLDALAGAVVVPVGGDDARLGGQPGLLAGPRGPGVAAVLPSGSEGDGVAAGAGGEVPAVSELVRPPCEPEAGVLVALAELPAGGDQPPGVRDDVPGVEVCR